MVEKILMPGRNVVDFVKYRQGRKAIVMPAAALRAPLCRHCGAALDDGESEDECSGAGFSFDTPRLRESPRKFYAD